ncbi:hypothetical protein [Thermoactinomyces mirandus]|uniref:hypothetical protein n=1 Tax=Thermoactinomyces mirandus TaxID=2756294 RepID=UPI001FE36994|nr:hypothetical protein [Thermoactinomyces mirandus]
MGNLTGGICQSAKKLLQSIEKDFLSAQDISQKTGLPLFKVHSSLRELVIKKDSQYKMALKALEYLH